MCAHICVCALVEAARIRVSTIKLFYFKFYNIHNIKYISACVCATLLLLGNHFILFGCDFTVL